MIAKKQSSQFLSLLVSLGLLLSLVALFLYIAVYPKIPGDNSPPQYAIFFAPGTKSIDAFNAVIAAGGIPIRGGAFDFVMIATSKNPDFQKKIKKLGAVFVGSAIIRGGCFFENQGRFTKQ